MLHKAGKRFHRVTMAVIGAVVVGSITLACEPAPSPAPSTAVIATILPTPGGPSAAPEPTTEPTPEPTDSRSGVPAELADRMWFTSNGFAGTIGRDDTMQVPADEDIVAVGGGLIVSSQETSLDDNTRATLRVRALGNDAVVGEFPTDLMRVRGIIIEQPELELLRLFFAGLDGRGIGPDEASFVDGGVWAVDLNRNDEPHVVVEPGAPIEEFGENAERGEFVASPSGDTVVSRVGGFTGVRSDVIDTRERRLRTTLDENAVAITEDLAFVFRESEANPRVTALFIEVPEEEAWTFPTPDRGYEIFELEAVVPNQDGVAFGYHRAGEAFNEFAITLVNVETGEGEDVIVNQPEDLFIDHLAQPFSGGEWLALTPQFWDTAIQEGEPISLVAAGRGELRREALRIVLP